MRFVGGIEFEAQYNTDSKASERYYNIHMDMCIYIWIYIWIYVYTYGYVTVEAHCYVVW